MEKRFFNAQQVTILKLVLDGASADEIAILTNEDKSIVQEQVSHLVMTLLYSNAPHAVAQAGCATAGC